MSSPVHPPGTLRAPYFLLSSSFFSSLADEFCTRTGNELVSLKGQKLRLFCSLMILFVLSSFFVFFNSREHMILHKFLRSGAHHFPPVVDISLHIICHEDHWRRLPSLVESIMRQTKHPAEIILVLSVKEQIIKAKQEREGLKKAGHFIDSAIFSILVSSSMNIKLHVRRGDHSPGSNRSYASRQSTSNLLTFFDCDDYMHPQRTESLYQLFQNNPDLHGCLHDFHTYTYKDFTSIKNDFIQPLPPKIVEASLKPPWPYDELRLLLPHKNETLNMTMKESEPNWPEGDFWWHFPSDMFLSWPDNVGGGNVQILHNGWGTFRRVVFNSLDFPDIFYGEDSLFNWRVIRSGFNFTGIPAKLGAYIRY